MKMLVDFLSFDAMVGIPAEILNKHSIVYTALMGFALLLLVLFFIEVIRNTRGPLLIFACACAIVVTILLFRSTMSSFTRNSAYSNDISYSFQDPAFALRKAINVAEVIGILDGANKKWLSLDMKPLLVPAKKITTAFFITAQPGQRTRQEERLLQDIGIKADPYLVSRDGTQANAKIWVVPQPVLPDDPTDTLSVAHAQKKFEFYGYVLAHYALMAGYSAEDLKTMPGVPLQ